jgi:hypothetical protein
MTLLLHNFASQPSVDGVYVNGIMCNALFGQSFVKSAAGWLCWLALLLPIVTGIWVQPPATCTNDTQGFCQPVSGTEFVCRYSYMGPTAVCRAAAGLCDIAETCNGTTAGECPPDKQQPNCPPVCPTAGLPICVNASTGG